MKRRRIFGATALVLVLALGLAWATFGQWGWRLENAIWPPVLGEYGERAYERLSTSPVHPYPAATSVRLFVWDDKNIQEMEYVEPSGRLLTADQRTAFEATLSKVSQRKYAFAACFIPHHFFRYYDARGKMIGEVSVCFCCSGAAANPELFKPTGGIFLHPYQNELTYDRERLGALIRSWGLPSDVWCRERAEPR